MNDYMDFSFLVTFIKTKEEQPVAASKFLKANCTYVDNNVWIYEGDIGCLYDVDADFNEIDEGVIGCIGDLTQMELVDLLSNTFGIDVYDV